MTAVKYQTAFGLAERIIKWRLDITKCRGQGLDGVFVMKVAYNGAQQIKQRAPHTYFVRCGSHNLKSAVNVNREMLQM